MAIDYSQDANCVAYFAMRDSTSEANRATGASDSLTVSSGDTIETSVNVPAGYSGTSRVFAAADGDYLYQADGGPTDIYGANQPLTICAWVKLESDPSADMVIASKYNLTADRQYSLAINADNSPIFYLSNSSVDGTAGESVTHTSAVSVGTWAHVCGVYDDTNMLVYLNGSAISASKTDGIYNGSMQFRVGARGDDARYLNGLIMDVALFTRALSSTEINNIMNDGVDGTKGSGVIDSGTRFMTCMKGIW